MSTNPRPVPNFRLATPLPDGETARRWLDKARAILMGESQAIAQTAERLATSFVEAVDRILRCDGRVIVTGIGKAGLIGQKIVASFCSTGTPSYFLHPAEAVHGDLGAVQSDDLVLALSYSGESEEITRLLPSLRSQSSGILAITSNQTSTLARCADTTILVGKVSEVCPLGLAPSSSTTTMLAIGDALALVASEHRGFTSEDFARYHPAGALGRSLMTVDQIMRPLSECRIAFQTQTLRTVLVNASRPGRRSGAIMLTDADGLITGVFTDSDLAKLLERSGEVQLDRPVSDCMTKRFQTVRSGQRLTAALSILAQRKISELPVIDNFGRPLGLIDITDVMSLLSAAPLPTSVQSTQSSDSQAADDGPRLLPIRRTHS